jgi:Tfp pilus assembly protein PilP
MRRLAIMTLALTLTLFAGCKQTAEDRYQRYLEEVADSSSMIEYITPEKDPVAPPTDDGSDPFANDNEGVYTIPEIPQQRQVDMNSNTYELDKYMRGKE